MVPIDYPMLVSNLSRTFTRIGALTAFLLAALSAEGAAPTITVINPSSPPAGSSDGIPVTITGTGFSNNGNVTVTFNPATVTAENVQVVSDTSITATFKLLPAATGKVMVTVTTPMGGPSNAFPWDTGATCLEAIAGQGCVWRWTVDVSGVSNTGLQTKNNTTPNITTSLNYQYQFKASSTAEEIKEKKNAEPKVSTPRPLFLHGVFSAGYTQVPNGATVTNSLTSTPSTTTSTTGSTSLAVRPRAVSSGAMAGCPTSSASSSGGSSSMSTNCNALVTQQAFVADVRSHFGVSFGQDGESVYSELGVGVRGSFSALTQSNQVVTSGGLSYVSLPSLNPRSFTALYEGVLHFKVAQHDTLTSSCNKVACNQSSSDLLMLEVGYQNNSGLAQLATNPQTNTRNRIVGRFYLSPELPGGTHTKGVIGVEYSGGISGGPGVVQIFWGTNLNPVKMLSPTPSN